MRRLILPLVAVVIGFSLSGCASATPSDFPTQSQPHLAITHVRVHPGRVFMGTLSNVRVDLEVINLASDIVELEADVFRTLVHFGIFVDDADGIWRIAKRPLNPTIDSRKETNIVSLTPGSPKEFTVWVLSAKPGLVLANLENDFESPERILFFQSALKVEGRVGNLKRTLYLHAADSKVTLHK